MLRLTVLGSGTSMGVPTLGCPCRVCSSTDPHDSRTRASILLTYNDRNILIDTSPDFRFQALRAGIRRLDAVLFTHAHADHIMGLDDIRPFNLRQQAALPIFAAPEVLASLRSTFSYIFSTEPAFSSIPLVELHPITGPFHLFGLDVIPIPAIHGPGRVLGFRAGRAAYLTDFSAIPADTLPLLRDLDDFILDALRFDPHPMHSTVAQSLDIVRELRPRRAWFTHIAHDLPHAPTNAFLAEKIPGSTVALAFDGLSFPVSLNSSLPSGDKDAGSSLLGGRSFSSDIPTARASGRTSLPPADAKSRITTRDEASPLSTHHENAHASPLRVFHSLSEFSSAHPAPAPLSPADPASRTVLTIGVFDGVHRGHQSILARVVTRARELAATSLVLTFDPHPEKILRPDSAPPMISTLQQRLDAFAAAGIDAALVLPFDRALSLLSPEDFVRRILVETLRARAVLVGENFHFGHKQAGNVRSLTELGAAFGPHQSFEVEIVPPVFTRAAKNGARGEIVSSTAVRRAVSTGRLAHARRLLGRPFVLTGEIRPGTGQGRKLVVPTLNLAPDQQLLPAPGVYATHVTLLPASQGRGLSPAVTAPTSEGVLTPEANNHEVSELSRLSRPAPHAESSDIPTARASGPSSDDKDSGSSFLGGRSFSSDIPTARASGRTSLPPADAQSREFLRDAASLPSTSPSNDDSSPRTFSAVTNIGTRPTFNGSHLTVESHLFDFSDSLTSGKMEIRFLHRLRDERRFPSPAALRSQILADIARARRLFRPSNPSR